MYDEVHIPSRLKGCAPEVPLCALLRTLRCLCLNPFAVTFLPWLTTPSSMSCLSRSSLTLRCSSRPRTATSRAGMPASNASSFYARGSYGQRAGRKKPEEEMREAVRDGRRPTMRWHQRKDGSRLFVEGTMVALRNPTGKLMGVGRGQTGRRSELLLLAARSGGAVRPLTLSAQKARVCNRRKEASVRQSCAQGC